MKEIRAEIEINASPQRVWQILTDFARYSEWNPFIRGAIGEAKAGERIEISIETPSGKNRRYHPTVLSVENERELRWAGRSALPGLMSGEHIFSIEQAGPNHVRFVQREIFGGFLASFFGKDRDDDIQRGLEKMNKALKARAELTLG